MLKCDAKKSKLLAQHRDETPVREMRVERSTPTARCARPSRCVMTLQDWRTRIGKDSSIGSTTSSTRTPRSCMPRVGRACRPSVKLTPDDDAEGQRRGEEA